MILPDLAKYRSTFIDRGVIVPLPKVTADNRGLLKNIAPVPADRAGWPWSEETNPSIFSGRENWPKLTIVTPSYNQAEFLEQTIRSVLLQNYPNLEYIIIDGGSTDGSTEIIEKYAQWISYQQSEKDGGQGNAINLGFSLSSGDYHAWINSDDYYLKGVFFKVIDEFLKTKVDFVYGYGCDYRAACGQFSTTKVLPFTDFFIKIPGLPQPSAFWSVTIHEPVWEELHCALDYELWLRLVKGHSRSLIKEPLSVANIHDDAKTSDPKMASKWEEDHQRIWSEDAHGRVYEWKRIIFLNKIRKKLYDFFYDK